MAVSTGLGNYYPPEVAAGLDGSVGRIIAFKLGGGAVPPPAAKSAEALAREAALRELPRPPLPRQATQEQYKQGAALYRRMCSACHNNAAPDLRRMSLPTHGEFREVVLEGTRAEKGMAGFGHLLTDVVFLNHGRNVLDIETSALEERFTKLIVETSAADAARRLAPLSELQTLQGVEFIFDGVPRAQLQEEEKKFA